MTQRTGRELPADQVVVSATAISADRVLVIVKDGPAMARPAGCGEAPRRRMRTSGRHLLALVLGAVAANHRARGGGHAPALGLRSADDSALR